MIVKRSYTVKVTVDRASLAIKNIKRTLSLFEECPTGLNENTKSISIRRQRYATKTHKHVVFILTVHTKRGRAGKIVNNKVERNVS